MSVWTIGKEWGLVGKKERSREEKGEKRKERRGLLFSLGSPSPLIPLVACSLL